MYKVIFLMIALSSCIIPLKGQSLNDSTLFYNYLDSAQTLQNQGDFGEAENMIQSAIQVTQKKGLTNESLADFYLKIGMYHFNNQYFIKSADWFLRVRKIVSNSNSIDAKVSFAKSINKLGLVFWEQADYQTALDYFKQINTLGNQENVLLAPEFLDVYNNMSFVFAELEEYDSTLKYNKMCFGLLETVVQNKEHGPYVPFYKTILWDAKGNTLTKIGKYDTAREYLLQSIKDKIKIFGSEHVNIAYSYSLLGDNASKQGNYEEADQYYEKALMIRKSRYNNTGPAVSYTYSELGDSHLQMKHLNVAQAYYDSALMTNKKIDLGAGYVYAAPAPAFKAMNGIAIILKEKVEEENYTERLDALYKSFVSQVNFTYEKSSPNLIQKSVKPVFDQLFEHYYNLYQRSEEVKHLNKLWELTELNKSRKMAVHVSHKKGMVSLIPEEYAFEEKALKDSITFYINKSSYDIGNTQYDSILFELNLQYDQLIIKLEEQYPKYSSLKYNGQVTLWSELQKRINTNQSILEFFVGEHDVFCFLVTTDDIALIKIPEADRIAQTIYDLRNTIIPGLDDQLSENIRYQKFTEASHELYQQFFEPIKEKLSSQTSELIIIPDQFLEYLPFELITTSVPEEEVSDYRKLPYLLKDYAIHYAYSATSLYANRTDKKVKDDKSLLAFAPSYQENSTQDNQVIATSSFRSSLSPLKWNQDEVNNISAFTNATRYTGEEATEDAFKRNAGDYSIIHLALHALSNSDEPLQSELAFTSSNDNEEDGFLKVYEIYEMDLMAEMVVLSGCETGFGKLEYGEGLMSLGRAFSFAGCPTTVTSHWLVDDASTSKLMTNFYKNLSEGMSKSRALRQAKLDLLNNDIAIYSKPLYWAGFVVIGDNSPVDLNVGNDYIEIVIWISLAFIVLTIAAIVYKKRKA